MSVARSQRFLYFQNKANHYHRLRNIRSSIDHSPPSTRIPKAKVFRPIPFLHQHEIQVQNQQLINRLCNIAQSQRTELAASGVYSRFNKVDRPFRERSPVRLEKERAITIDNSDMKQRLQNVKPAIGSHNKWDKQYHKFIDNSKNMSRYDNNKSKAQLHISTDNFIPQHLRDYALKKHSLDKSAVGKERTVPIEKLFELPQIGSKDKRVDFHFNELKRQRSEDQLEAKE